MSVPMTLSNFEGRDTGSHFPTGLHTKAHTVLFDLERLNSGW